MHLGIIGKKECIAAFRALGVRTYPVENSEEAREKLRKISEEDFAIIFITESLAEEIYNNIAEVNEKTFSTVTIIPDPSGTKGFAGRVIRDAMLRAVGTDITKDS